MNQLLKLLSTAAAGALDVWVGIITGLALGLSPALSGALSIASALAEVTLGAPPRPLLLWMLASVVLWGAVLTGAAALGFSIFGL